MNKKSSLVFNLWKMTKKIPKLRFKEFSGEWEEKKLGEIGEIIKGKQLSKTDMLEHGDYYVLNGGVYPSGFTDNYNTNENTITISEGGNSCGYVNFNIEKFWSGGHCYSLLNIKNINNLFLYHFLKFYENEIMGMRVGSGLPNIQKKDLINFLVFSPSLLEQQKIASFLSSIDDKIDNIKFKVENIKEFKKGIMQQMFV